MRNAILTLLALLCVGAIHRPQAGGSPWTPGQITALEHGIDARLADPVLRGAQVGFELVDTARGTTLYSRNRDREFMPASNMKLLTGSAALAKLGTAFVFETAVDADAQPQDGTLSGNLYLRGGGDAQLSAKDLDDAASALAAQGIKRITGALLIDGGRYDEERYASGWLWDDLPYYYAPALTALELEEGVVHVTMSASATVGAPVTLRVWPQSSTYTIDNRVASGMPGSKDTSDIVRPWNAPHTIELVGSYPQGAHESDDLAPTVPDPEAYAGDVFARALEAHGILVAQGARSGSTPARAVQLWSHRSALLPQLLADMWIPSDNLMAEMFLKELGIAQSGVPGSDANGATFEKAYLQSMGVNPGTVTISDGSGLSAYDRITPQDLIAILQSDWNSPSRELVLDALPIAGVRGTLKDAYAGTNAEGAVFAKTGTWTHVTTLSGYVETRTHGPVTFSLLINDWLGDHTPHGPDDLARVRSAIFSEIASQ